MRINLFDSDRAYLLAHVNDVVLVLDGPVVFEGERGVHFDARDFFHHRTGYDVLRDDVVVIAVQWHSVTYFRFHFRFPIPRQNVISSGKVWELS